MIFEGTAHKYGRDVDTDVIIPARYLNTHDPGELAAHCMEDIDQDFIGRVQPGTSLSPMRTLVVDHRGNRRRWRSGPRVSPVWWRRRSRVFLPQRHQHRPADPGLPEAAAGVGEWRPAACRSGQGRGCQSDQGNHVPG